MLPLRKQLTYLIFTDTVCVCVVDDASSEPLIRPCAQDVIPAVFQEGLKSEEQSTGKKVPKAAVAVPPLHLSTYELLRTAHVQLPIHTQVLHQRFDSVSLCVGIILDKVKPVIFIDVMV